MAHHIGYATMQSVANDVYGGSLKGFVMAQSVNRIAVDAIRVNQHICTDLMLFKKIPEGPVGYHPETSPSNE